MRKFSTCDGYNDLYMLDIVVGFRIEQPDMQKPWIRDVRQAPT
ncbi:MAG: hypothetical protein M5U15_03835 [Kiritimatiellae bacterium]|nr:hypothetical protein [Kiritimatiellia bacterium]